MAISFLKRIGSSVGSRRSRDPVAPPVLGPAVRFPYGPFQFKIKAGKGVQFEVHATTDLKSWHPIAAETSGAEVFDYVDSDASKFSYRFYRLLAGEVYSANVIGYATITLPPGFSMIANPFDAPSNTVSELFKELPEGTTLNKFDTRFFRLNENSFKNGRWTNPSETLVPGEGAILFNPTSDYKLLSFVGDLMQGQLSLPIPGGFSIRSSLVPQPGRIHTDLGFPIAEGDVIHLFDRDRQKYVLYPYDPDKWAANPPVLSVCEAFWVAKTLPGNWVRNFSLTA
jgi:hypothetical protein